MSIISIILPTKNNENHIGDLLNSIFYQIAKENIEVIMLDSSDDLTPNIALEYSEKHNLKMIRVEPEDYNYGGTRNLGASLSSGDIIVFISTDVDITDNYWLAKLMKNFKDPLVAGVYGKQIPKKNASPMEEFFINYTYPNIRKVYYLDNTSKLTNFFFSNTNSAIKKEVWEKIPLPEMLKSEDQEWAKRALLAGYKIIYDPDAFVYHSHRYTLKGVFQEYFDSGATLPYVYSTERINLPSFYSRGLRYKIEQLRYFIKKSYLNHIPYTIVYDSMKFLGYFLGTRYKMMPKNLRRLLCKKSNHWDKYDDSIPADSYKNLNNRKKNL